MSDRKRLLEELRVIDLRAELEKRNLDKTGIRSVLLQRLSKHLEEEGHDPTTYRFELSSSDSNTPSKRTRRTESSLETESENAPAMEDMIVQDTAGDEEETEQAVETNQSSNPDQEDNKKSEEKMDVDENEKVCRKRELKDDSDSTQAKKPCIEKEAKNDEDHKTENNTDAEDSINLDIGDDELLNEETDNPAKNKKDDPAHEDAAETTGDETAANNSTAATDSVPAENQQQVNSEAPTISNESEKNEKDQKDDKNKENESEKKDKKDDSKEGGARNLWVSGLSGDTRAKDLKQLCSKHGKVIGAKVVTNARTPGSRCYGYVTMASAQDAENCIKNLHRTELHGRMISVEKAKSESESASRKQLPARPERRPSKDRKDEAKENEDPKQTSRNVGVSRQLYDETPTFREVCSCDHILEGPRHYIRFDRPQILAKEHRFLPRMIREAIEIKKHPNFNREGGWMVPPAWDPDSKEGGEKSAEIKIKKEGEVSGAESTRSTSRTREKSHRSDKDRTKRSTRSRERRRSPREVLSFSKIWKERDVARARERSRAAREEERRRRAAEDALRERERRQRQEKHRLALEREKLRAEREKIEREKNELLRLERERHRLEREKLELERLELKRAQLRLEEERRKRGYESSAAYRKPASSPPPEPGYDRDQRHKRPPPPPMFEAPPPPRFDMAPGYDRGADKRDRERDYKRDYPRHVSSGSMKYPSNGSASDDTRQPMPPGTRPKEPSRSYDSRDSRSYRPSPPGKPEPRNWNASNRYPETAPPAKGSGGSSLEGWGTGEARYGGSYEARYAHAPAYQPPPPGAPYPDRYTPAARDFARKY